MLPAIQHKAAEDTAQLILDIECRAANQLVQEYGVARGTARKAIQLLRERQLVVTVVGRGTYVATSPDGQG